MGRERPTGMVFSGGQLRWEAPVRGRESGTAQAMAWSDVPAGEGLPAELLRELPTQGGCLVALSGAEVMLRPAVFPTIETDELAGMVELQVDQISPFSTDESTRSYEVVAQREQSGTIFIVTFRRPDHISSRKIKAGNDSWIITTETFIASFQAMVRIGEPDLR